MNKRRKLRITMLSDHDREILDRYTHLHTNFIESPTAKAEYFQDGKINNDT